MPAPPACSRRNDTDLRDGAMALRLSRFRKTRLCLIFLAFAGVAAWLCAKPFVEFAVSRAIGHDVSIEGSLSIHLLPAPGLNASRVAVAAPEWSARKAMLTIGQLSVSADPAALLHGRLVLNDVHLEKPVLLVERTAQGRLNWAGRGQGGLDTDTAGPLSGLPGVRHLVLSDGKVNYYNHGGRAFEATVGRAEWRKRAGGPGALRASGALGGAPWQLDLSLEPALSQAAGSVYPVSLRLHAGPVQASVQGSAGWPLTREPTDLRLSVEGNSLASALGTSPSGRAAPLHYAASGRLQGRGKAWQMSSFALQTGGIGLHGRLGLDLRSPRPFISGDLTATASADDAVPELKRVWDVLRGAHTASSAPQDVFGWLRRVDGRVKLAAGPAIAGAAALQQMRMELELQAGVLKVDPLLLYAENGSVRANLRLDARAQPPQGRLVLTFDRFPIAPFAGARAPAVLRQGRLNGEVALAFSSNSIQRAESGLRYLAPGGTDIRVDLAQEGGTARPLQLHARGRLHGEVLRVDASADPLALFRQTAMMPFSLSAKLGATRIEASGRASTAASRFDAGLSVSGPGTSALSSLLGVHLPKLPRYAASAHVALAEGGSLLIRDADLRVGQSRFTASGELDPRRGRLDLRRLHGRVGGGTLTAQARFTGIGAAPHGEFNARIEHVNLGRALRPLGLAQRFPGVLDGNLSIALGAMEKTARRSVLRYRDQEAGSDIRIRVRQLPAAIQVDMRGRYRGEPIRLHGRGGPPRRLVGPGRYPFSLEFMALATHGRIKGSLHDPLHLDGLDAALSLAGPNPRRIEPVLGFRVPELPPYSLSGHLSRKRGAWSFGPFEGTVGNSDLSGRIHVDFLPGKPRVVATLHSRLLDLDDVAGVIGAAPGAAPGDVFSAEQRRRRAALERRATVLPDENFELDRLGQMEAEVNYAADRLDTDVVPVEALRLAFSISGGRLAMAPLAATVAGGRVRVDARLVPEPGARPPRGRLKLDIADLRLRRVLDKLGAGPKATGRINGRGEFRTSGASVAAMLSSLDGQMGLSMEGGTMDALLVELGGLDMGEALLLWLGDDHAVGINCARIQARPATASWTWAVPCSIPATRASRWMVRFVSVANGWIWASMPTRRMLACSQRVLLSSSKAPSRIPHSTLPGLGWLAAPRRRPPWRGSCRRPPCWPSSNPAWAAARHAPSGDERAFTHTQAAVCRSKHRVVQ